MPKLARRPDADSLPRCIGEGSASLSPLSRPILAETEWSFTLPTRQAPIQPARPTACSLQAKTLRAVGAPGNGGLALFSSASGSAYDDCSNDLLFKRVISLIQSRVSKRCGRNSGLPYPVQEGIRT